MYTATIGKRLIQALNERDKAEWTPRQFVSQSLFGCLFNTDRYLIHLNNSPFAQAYNQKGKKPLTDAVLTKCGEDVHAKIADNKRDASIFFGAPSSDLLDSTSGQVTSLQREAPADDVYASWIGTALGITIEGGLTLLVDDPEVNLLLREGWDAYRELLNQTPKLKGNQINTWNGHWVAHRFGKHTPGEQWTPTTDKEGGAISTVSWVQLLFALSHYFRKSPSKTINAYVYSFGQTNRTAGFVRLNLPRIRRLGELYSQLFTVPDGLQANAFEKLYQTELSFTRAFQCGEIGVRALQPKDLRDLLDAKKQPKYSATDAQKVFLFQIQQLWIIAMLNNEKLITKAEALAQVLRDYAAKDKNAKMVLQRKAEDVLSSRTRRDFVAGLTEIIGGVGDANVAALNDLVTEIMSLPAENVPLFLTLLRFKYAYLAAKPAAPTTGTLSV